MQNRSHGYGLRLLCLSLSLFCLAIVCVTISGQSKSAPKQPPGLSVLDCKWRKHVFNGMMYPTQVPPPPAVGEHRDGAPNPIVDWPSGTAYFYSLRIKNEGSKVIRSMA